MFRTAFLVSLAALVCDSASAAEVQFEGFYRARARAFNTLSLDREAVTSEAWSKYVQHRLVLQPRFLVTDDASVSVELRGFDNLYWGDQPGAATVFVENGPPTFDPLLTAPTSETDPNAPLSDITLARVYATVNTPIGTFDFGRMPLHWGLGMWQNDGVSGNKLYSDYGDTTDRFQWEYLIRDQVYLRAAVDMPAERFINEGDDSVAYQIASAYRVEELIAGLVVNIDRTPSRSFNLVTIDLSGDVTVGKLRVATEFAGQFGGGDLDNGLNQVSITAIGAVLEAELDLSPLRFGVNAGLASGDGDDTDARFKTFTFDRDYSVGMFLFEQPMPALAAAAANDVNGGRSYEVALTGNALSNALFLKPYVAREIVEGLEGEIAVLAARTAKVPERFGGRTSYGVEGQATVRYTAVENVTFDTTFGMFLPGTYYRDYFDDTYESFDDAAFGLQIGARVDF